VATIVSFDEVSLLLYNICCAFSAIVRTNGSTSFSLCSCPVCISNGLYHSNCLGTR
jgi:hypothetical protein